MSTKILGPRAQSAPEATTPRPKGPPTRAALVKASRKRLAADDRVHLDVCKMSKLAVKLYQFGPSSSAQSKQAGELAAMAIPGVAQALRHLGVLCYGWRLYDKVEGQVAISARGPDAAAIRAGVVVACAELAERGGVTDAQVAAFLSLVASSKKFKTEASPAPRIA